MFVVAVLLMSACSLQTSALSPGDDSGDVSLPSDGEVRDSVVADGEVPDGPAMDATWPDVGPADTGLRMDSMVVDSAAADTTPSDSRRPDMGLSCPSSYSMNVVGTCYRIVTSPRLDWQDAERACEADGAHLVVVNDAAEDALVPDLHWIGYSETVTEGTFLWVTGAGASSYVVWGGTDPDRLADAYCVVQRPDDWHDDNCYETKPYVCEFDGRAADPAAWR